MHPSLYTVGTTPPPQKFIASLRNIIYVHIFEYVFMVMINENDIFLEKTKLSVIYGLFDKNEPLQIRYVGATTDNPINRLKGHLNSNSTNNKRLKEWFNEVKVSGSEIGMRILGKYNVNVLPATEQKWIQFWELYCDNLNSDVETLKRNKKFNECQLNRTNKFNQTIKLKQHKQENIRL